MRQLLWFVIAAVGAAAWGVLALSRGETINAAWLVLAAVGTYLVAYRVYSRCLAYRVFGLTNRRATPAERLNNGRDFMPTTRWVLFGHHFAAIAGAGHRSSVHQNAPEGDELKAPLGKVIIAGSGPAADEL